MTCRALAVLYLATLLSGSADVDVFQEGYCMHGFK